jgi:AcrR family transcriptional regulator
VRWAERLRAGARRGKPYGLQMLADEVRLGKPTLNHYFASKTEILCAIHQMHIAALLDGLDSEQRRASTLAQKLAETLCATFLQGLAKPG